MVSNGDSREEVLSFVKELGDPCTIVVDILNDILTFEKIDAGEMSIERVAVDPLRFVESTTAPFRISARLKHIELVLNLELPRGVLTISIDDTKVLALLLVISCCIC